jgi:hypothetical protein
MVHARCCGKDRKGDACRNKGLGESKFCKFHEHMTDYTDEMLANLELCKGCNKMYFFGGETKTCENCKNRGKENKIKKKETVVLCEKEGCKYKKSAENKYCGKHQLCVFVDETKEQGKKMCRNYVRGCRARLDLEYPFSNCGDCLAKEREHDASRRDVVVEKNADNANSETRFCTTCYKELTMEHFVGEVSEVTKTCNVCREKCKIQDAKRDREHRNELARKNEAKPENILKKAEWREENYEKVAKTWMDSRQRKMENLGMEEYLKQGAESAKLWREKHPEKMAETNENKKNSREQNFNIYKRTAEYKNLEFGLTFEDFVNIAETGCYYCGELRERGFNGIDRADSGKGYILENCVSCCEMCNFMKGSTSDQVFIKRVEHILTFQGKIQGRTFPECFANHNASSYEHYRHRASTKGMDFEITKEDYILLIAGDCFMCGKQKSEEHTNGIDRMDNNKGYIQGNINSCCYECNIMKKNYDYDEIMRKFVLIYEMHKNDDFESAVPDENNRGIVANKNKRTKGELDELRMARMEKQRESLKDRYNDEEYKWQRARELAELRKLNK